jgi:hypothetical protein
LCQGYSPDATKPIGRRDTDGAGAARRQRGGSGFFRAFVYLITLVIKEEFANLEASD